MVLMTIKKFPHTQSIGLYPIVDSSEWVEKLLPLGVKTIQLRVKNVQGVALANIIRDSVSLAKKWQAQLFINDYWQLAIEYGAFGVHLGQEDVLQTDIDRIYTAGLHLGISTHCPDEVKLAKTLAPSYIACGTIFPTTSKAMPLPPQGLTQLAYWCQTLDYPVVAIGGINAQNIKAVMATKAAGIAMISAITQASDPIKATRYFLQILAEGG